MPTRRWRSWPRPSPPARRSVIAARTARCSIEPRPAAIYLWVEDVDATYERAVAAGAASESAPADKPYGHRIGGVVDPNGVTWWISSPIVVVR